jgi:hypothetical protein
MARSRHFFAKLATRGFPVQTPIASGRKTRRTTG